MLKPTAKTGVKIAAKNVRNAVTTAATRVRTVIGTVCAKAWRMRVRDGVTALKTAAIIAGRAVKTPGAKNKLTETDFCRAIAKVTTATATLALEITNNYKS